jgi:hypothetical protein
MAGGRSPRRSTTRPLTSPPEPITFNPPEAASSEFQHDPLRHPNDIRRHFPLYLFEDYDKTFPMSPWHVGLKSSFPEEVFRRVSAALISVQLGVASMDNIYKKYTKSQSYAALARLDISAQEFIVSSTECFQRCLIAITHRSEARMGRILFEWTLLRLPFAFRHLLTCANRGGLYT